MEAVKSFIHSRFGPK